jgi:hypothetical protein
VTALPSLGVQFDHEPAQPQQSHEALSLGYAVDSGSDMSELPLRERKGRLDQPPARSCFGRQAALCLSTGRAPAGREERACPSAEYVAELASRAETAKMRGVGELADAAILEI